MDNEQHELYEYANKRIKQKKGLYNHFVILIVGGLFIYITNKWLSVYPETTWWIWFITFWAFFFILHFIKVFVTDSFMNKQWERNQIDKLIVKQSKKIEQIRKELDDKNIPIK